MLRTEFGELYSKESEEGSKGEGKEESEREYILGKCKYCKEDSI